MKTLLTMLALAGAIALAEAAVEQWTGSSTAIAQSRSSACLQNCMNVRRWPEGQCRQFCRGKSKTQGMQYRPQQGKKK
jgi:uncharacterized low-complexity protein